MELSPKQTPVNLDKETDPRCMLVAGSRLNMLYLIDCWALAELDALLSAFLVYPSFSQGN